MYNIPKVTDCSRELNEWVYSGDRTRLMSTQPRQLPELVRRFTQDIYMCVYVQPDVAMYGDDDDWSLEENSSEEHRTSEHLTGFITNSESVSLLHEELSRLYIETRPIKVCTFPRSGPAWLDTNITYQVLWLCLLFGCDCPLVLDLFCFCHSLVHEAVFRVCSQPLNSCDSHVFYYLK